MKPEPSSTATRAARAKGRPARTARAEQREKSRSLILLTATRLFAERGFDGVSLEVVAQAAGMKKSLLLYYFNSKDELWRACAENVARAFNLALRGKISRIRVKDPKEQLRETMAASLDAFLEQPDFPRFLVREGGLDGPRIRWLVEHFNYSTVEYGSPELRDYLGKSIIRDALFSIFLSMAALGPLMEVSLSYVSGRAKAGVYPMSPQTRDELVGILMRFVLAVEPIVD